MSVFSYLDIDITSMTSSYSNTSLDNYYNETQEENQELDYSLEGYDEGMFFGLSEKDRLPPELPAKTRFTFTILYIVIMTLGLTGNVTTVLVIGLSREMRTVTNVFLVSLAISDGLIASLSMPVQLNNYLQNEWTLGVVMCKFTHYAQGVVIVASILTLAALAIDRYYAICHPLRARNLHTLTRAVLLIAVIWVTSSILLIPQIFIQRLDLLLHVDWLAVPPIREAFVCLEYFPDARYAIAYTSFFYIVLYALPVVIMLVTYGKIAHTLWSRGPIGETSNSQRESSRRLAENKRIICMLVIIVVMFTVNWFPFFTSQIYLLIHGQEGHQSESYRITMAYLQLLGYSNCCVNPIIYCFLNDSFQKSFFKIFTCQCTKGYASRRGGGGPSGSRGSVSRRRRRSSCTTDTDRAIGHGTLMTSMSGGGGSGVGGQTSPFLLTPEMSPDYNSTAV